VPVLVFDLAAFGIHGRQPLRRAVPVTAQHLQVGPVASGQSGGVRGSERDGLDGHRPHDGNVEDVSEELHEEVVGGHAAVYLERLQREPGVGVHRVHDFPGLPAGRLEDRAGQVTLGDIRGQAHDDAAGLVTPVRCEQAGKRRDDVAAAVVLDRTRERLYLRRRADQPQPVAEPLHERAGDGDRALQGVHGWLVADLVADGGEQAVRRAGQLAAGIEEQEAAGAIRALGLSPAEAGLPEQRGLLVAQRGRDAHAGQNPAGKAVCLGRWANLREHLAWHAEDRQQLVVPVQGREVHQEGTAGVCHVGYVRAAVRTAGKVPDEPALHGSEQHVTALGALAQARGVVEQPAHLRGGEVRCRRQAAALAHGLSIGAAGQLVDEGAGAGVLPHDRPPGRPAGVAVPQHGGFPLVGDAERDDLVDSGSGLGEGLWRDAFEVVPDLHRVVLDPARLGKVLFVLTLRDRDQPPAVVEQDAPGRAGALVHGHHVAIYHPVPTSLYGKADVTSGRPRGRGKPRAPRRVHG
jgi:hypothetical protein